ncbi:MAG: glycosyltransferase, partial [Planctomycetes bacterium]|nr:glycosyltransferase [Planctomycetota bacterium]
MGALTMRVLVLGSVLGQPAGGVRRHAAELLPRVARLLAEDGGALAVAVGAGGLGFELPESIELLHTTIPARPPLVRATLEGRWVRRLVDEARDAGRPFDLVHTAHHPVPRHLPVPHALLVHDLRALSLEHSPFSRRLFARQILGQGVERAAVVATVSEAVRAEVLRTFRVRPERVHVVPNGVDHLPVSPRAAAPDAPLLVLGHLEPRKNAALVLAALAHDTTLPRVVFAGAAKGDEEARLRRRADELGVDARVTFAGPVVDAELPRLYAEAACVVCPSALEGFGVVPAEAA